MRRHKSTAFRRFAGAISLAAATFVLAGSAMAHGAPDAEAQRLANGTLLDYLTSGAVHMITGYDPLLFLFGVMFFSRGFGTS